MTISIIVATTQNRVIGQRGKMPWRLSADLQYFKQTTSGHSLIMGRRTFESIGRALPNRRNIVVSRQAETKDFPAGVELARSLEEAFELTQTETEVFVIGGGEIYRQTLPMAQKIHLTQIQAKLEGDTFFPEINLDDWEIIAQKEIQKDEKNDYNCRILELVRRKNI